MRSWRLIAAAALVSTTMAAPAMAHDYCHYHRCYHRGPIGAAADVAGDAVGAAAGIAGAVIGTAGAIATAPFRHSYAYDRPHGYVCHPGTWFLGRDGRRHLCR